MCKKIDYNRIDELSNKMESIFSSNLDYKKNAYLNWRLKGKPLSERFRQLSHGYLETAEKNINDLLKDNDSREADILIFPILFDIVHGIELFLKALNYDLRSTLQINNVKISNGGHDIKQICGDSKKLLNDLGNKIGKGLINQPVKAIKLVMNFISNIYLNTSYMPFTRYPINNDGKDLFYIKSDENTIIDMEKLLEQLGYVKAMIDYLDNFVCYNTER